MLHVYTDLQSVEHTEVDQPPRMLVEVRNLHLRRAGLGLVNNVSFDVKAGEVLSFIGRDDLVHSLILRCMVRMEDRVRDQFLSGKILFQGVDVFDGSVDLPKLRRRIVLIGQEATPFKSSIWENVAYGVRLHQIQTRRALIEETVEAALKRALLWDDVKDRLYKKRGVKDLTGPQRRQLALARAFALGPDVLLLDKPTGPVDGLPLPLLEDILNDVRRECAVVMAAHTLDDAALLSDRVAFFAKGQLEEIDTAELVLTSPLNPMTQQFLNSATLL